MLGPNLPRARDDATSLNAAVADGPAAFMDLRELVAHLVDRWRLVFLCVVAALACASAYLLVAPPLYLATTSLLIDPNANGSLTADTGWSRGAPDASAVENQLRLVVADSVLRRVVDREKLLSDPEFDPQPGGILTRLLAIFGRQSPSSDDMMAGAITALRERVYTRRSERTFIIDIGVFAREARKSARLTDALAQAFVDDETASRVAIARQQSDEIKTKLADLKARIEEAERRVEDYKARHSIFDTDGKAMVGQQLADAQRDLAQAHLRTVEAKTRFDQLIAITNSGRDASALPDALRSPAIERIKAQIADIIRQQANLRTTLGPRHPAILESENQLKEARALLQAELRRIADGARNDYDIARTTEAALEKRVDELQTKTSDTNEALVKMRELQRDVEVSHAIYDRFLKASGFVASDAIDSPTVRVISAAIAPTRPESPKRLAVLSIALAAGLGLGLGLALFGVGQAVPDALGAARQAASDEQEVEPQGEPGIAHPNSPATSPNEPQVATAKAAAPFAMRQVAMTPRPAPSNDPVAEPLALEPSSPPVGTHVTASTVANGERSTPRQQFDLPLLLQPSEGELSLTQKVRGLRDPAVVLPHLRELEQHPTSRYSRAVRELRRALAARGGGMPLIIGVASEVRGGGKSTLAMNLARAFVDAGHRVLILDADRRHGSLTQLASVNPLEGTLRLAGGMRPVFALDRTWRSGIFLTSLILGRAERVRTPRQSEAISPSFASIKALADVLIVDTQSGAHGPYLGAEFGPGPTLVVSPAARPQANPRDAVFAHVSLVEGLGERTGAASPRRSLDATA
jgi:uncharacterized protein involved in exopolysaccharide biosynthesis/Mrp family chromosome partitioning ATPase